MRLYPFDKPIKSLYIRSFVVSILFARFLFKVIRKSLYWAKQWLSFCFPITDRKNKANLEAIEKAVFVLCLDQPPPHSTQSPSVMENPTCSVTARQSLHGDGTEYNSCNRWFDKIVQVPHTEWRQSMKPIVLIQSCFFDTSRFDTNLSSETAQQFRSHVFYQV